MNRKEGRIITKPEVDEDGFLVETERWSEGIAQILSREEVPKGLTDDHWKIIGYLRRYYLEFGSVPPVRMLSRDTGFSLRSIKGLFPNGLTKGACKIAGIPRSAIKPSFLYP